LLLNEYNKTATAFSALSAGQALSMIGVPEPSTFVMLSIAGFGFLVSGIKRKNERRSVAG